jgi:Domain of unknown function (DUF4249)
MVISCGCLAELSRQLLLVLTYKSIMKHNPQILLLSILLLFNSCITQFIPETSEDKELLIVEGLITDQPGANTIKLSRSLPLGTRSVANPVKGCTVTVSDDLGNTFSLSETDPGTYTSDPTKFQGVIGRTYTLHIRTNFESNVLNYQSVPVEIKPVPPIDSIYYEKVTITEGDKWNQPQEGCQVYLNTHDPANQCKFYRWEYDETWEFRLPYDVTNNICWISNNSDVINIKNTSVFEEDRIGRYPLNFISNLTDRLEVKYSILVNQYSLNENEYSYWEKLQKITEQVGGLYDITPASIPSNIWCIEDPNEKVFGYFSVSARSSKRIFIKDNFLGSINLYTSCPSDTITGNAQIPGLNSAYWVIGEYIDPNMVYNRIITDQRGCADCTVSGTKIKPDFWNEDK